MDMQRASRLAQWALDVQEWKDSGLTQRQWCAVKEIKLTTFRYRIRMLNAEATRRKAESMTGTTFSAVPMVLEQDVSKACPPEHADAIILEVADVKVQVTPGADLSQLKKILEVIKSC